MSTQITLAAPSVSTEIGWRTHKTHPITNPLLVTKTSASLPPFPHFDFKSNAVVRRLEDTVSTVLQLELMDKGEVRVTLAATDYQWLTSLWEEFIETVGAFERMNRPLLAGIGPNGEGLYV